jgi:hypothetical protein
VLGIIVAAEAQVATHERRVARGCRRVAHDDQLLVVAARPAGPPVEQDLAARVVLRGRAQHRAQAGEVPAAVDERLDQVARGERTQASRCSIGLSRESTESGSMTGLCPIRGRGGLLLSPVPARRW